MEVARSGFQMEVVTPHHKSIAGDQADLAGAEGAVSHGEVFEGVAVEVVNRRDLGLHA